MRRLTEHTGQQVQAAQTQAASAPWQGETTESPPPRFDEHRRYSTLAASLAELAATLTGTALEMHDRILGNLFKQGQQKQRAQAKVV